MLEGDALVNDGFGRQEGIQKMGKSKGDERRGFLQILSSSPTEVRGPGWAMVLQRLMRFVWTAAALIMIPLQSELFREELARLDLALLSKLSVRLWLGALLVDIVTVILCCRCVHKKRFWIVVGYGSLVLVAGTSWVFSFALVEHNRATNGVELAILVIAAVVLAGLNVFDRVPKIIVSSGEPPLGISKGLRSVAPSELSANQKGDKLQSTNSQIKDSDRK